MDYKLFKKYQADTISKYWKIMCVTPIFLLIYYCVPRTSATPTIMSDTVSKLWFINSATQNNYDEGCTHVVECSLRSFRHLAVGQVTNLLVGLLFDAFVGSQPGRHRGLEVDAGPQLREAVAARSVVKWVEGDGADALGVEREEPRAPEKQ